MTDDAVLLLQYHRAKSEAALDEFVRRHLALVHGAARRRLCGDVHQAADVAQQVFATVARNAEALSRHPNLIAWLHSATRNAAADLLRGEQRRRRRETEALAVSIQNSDTEVLAPEELARLRSLLDEVLDSLPVREREAVLLRHFEEQSLVEIAQRQGISPDAARMRVNRGLERLRDTLVRRGYKAGGAGLLGLLSAEASVQPPVALAAQITTACQAGASGLGLGLGTTCILYMTSTKLGLLTAACLSLATGYWAFQEQESKVRFAEQLRQAQVRQEGSAHERQRLEQRSAEATRKWEEASKDLSALRALPQNAASAEDEQPITRTLVETRFRKARALFAAGLHREALAEYLWCYDIGMLRVDSFAAVRSSYVLAEIMVLSKHFPEARAELSRRRDQALEALLSGKSKRPDDLIDLNKVLGEEAMTLRTYDALPPDDKRRQDFRLFAFELFARQGRYVEAAQGRPLSSMKFNYESALERLRNPRVEADSSVGAREHLSKETALHIEVLAGVGDLANAGRLAERLLKEQFTAEDRSRIQEAFIRAGHPELANSYQAP